MTNKEKQKEALINYRMLRPLYPTTVSESTVIEMAIQAVNIIIDEFPDEEVNKEPSVENVDLKPIFSKYMTEGLTYTTSFLMRSLKAGEHIGTTKAHQMIKQAESEKIISHKFNKLILN